ncbi:MAG: zinc ribbon domain-containing protein [Promethearchaeota archaeon]
MAWVPCIVANRRYRSRGGGSIAAIIGLFLLFGVIFFFFINRSNGFTFPIFPIISVLAGFLMIIVAISIIAAAMSRSPKKPYESTFNSYQSQSQEQNHYKNPYRVQNSIQTQPEEFIYKEIKQEKPVDLVINFCRYCGEKADRDAKFCHQCGSIL